MKKLLFHQRTTLAMIFFLSLEILTFLIWSEWKIEIAFAFAFVLCISLCKLISEKRLTDFVGSFLAPFHNHAGNIGGIMVILFILIQVHALGTAFHELFDHKLHDWIDIVLFFEILLIPFLIVSAFVKQKPNEPIQISDRKILFTFLSKQSVPREKEFTDDNNNTIPLKDYWAMFKSGKKDCIPHSWKPVIQIFRDYPELKEVFLFISPEVEKDNTGYYDIYKSDIMIDILSDAFPTRNIRVNKITGVDIDNFVRCRDEINNQLIKLKKDPNSVKLSEDEREILFNITGGTACATAAMIYPATLENRGIVYTEQKGGSNIPIDVNIYSVRELWNELMHKL